MFFLAACALVVWIGGDFVYRKVAAKNIFLYASFSKFVLQPLCIKFLSLLRTETTGKLRRVIAYRFDVAGDSWILSCATCVQIKAIKPPVEISGVDMGRIHQAIAGWANYCMRPTDVAWRVRVLSRPNEERITDAVRLIRQWVSSTFLMAVRLQTHQELESIPRAGACEVITIWCYRNLTILFPVIIMSQW